MNLQNEVRFNGVVDAVFTKLAETFPHLITLDALDLGLSDEPAGEYVGGRFQPSESASDHLFFVAAIQWLIRAGYLYAADATGVVIQGAVLTEKALDLIGATPISLRRGNY